AQRRELGRRGRGRAARRGDPGRAARPRRRRADLPEREGRRPGLRAARARGGRAARRARGARAGGRGGNARPARPGRRPPPAPAARGAVLGAGRVLEADAVIWACGPWLGSLFPGVVSIRATSQDVSFFVPPGPGWTTADIPGWVDYDGAFYGHPDLDGLGVKA